jgi:mRNA interferase MazF
MKSFQTLMMANSLDPKRGEIWMVDFSPQVGDEIRKIRPAVVLNLPVFQTFEIRFVVPLTGWRADFHGRWTKVLVRADASNRLDKDSAADIHQARAVSLQRFVRQIGVMNPNALDIVAKMLAAYVGVK